MCHQSLTICFWWKKIFWIKYSREPFNKYLILSPPRQAWMKNIFGLFCSRGQRALSNTSNTQSNWETQRNSHSEVIYSEGSEFTLQNKFQTVCVPSAALRQCHRWILQYRETADTQRSSRTQRVPDAGRTALSTDALPEKNTENQQRLDFGLISKLTLHLTHFCCKVLVQTNCEVQLSEESPQNLLVHLSSPPDIQIRVQTWIKPHVAQN